MDGTHTTDTLHPLTHLLEDSLFQHVYFPSPISSPSLSLRFPSFLVGLPGVIGDREGWNFFIFFLLFLFLVMKTGDGRTGGRLRERGLEAGEDGKVSGGQLRAK